MPVNAGFDFAEQPDLTEREKFLNALQPTVPSPWSSVRLDAFTHHYALEYMKKRHPVLTYIAYGETDDFAHDGHYDAYLKSANTTDNFIRELWNFTQQDQFYKDHTVFIITTDHGRGTTPLATWRGHGNEVANAGEVWLITFGHTTTLTGEISQKEQLYSSQIAPTIAKILRLKSEFKETNLKPLDSIEN